MWAPYALVATTPRPRPATLEERLELVEAELAARDVLNRYACFYDAKDVDGLMAVFHPECVLVNPRGTYVGHDAIRENVAWAMAHTDVTFHMTPNTTVRVGEDRRSALVVSYLLAVAARKGAERVNANASSYVARVVLHEGEWVIRAFRITTNVPMLLPVRPAGPVPPCPTPTDATTSHDWIGADFVI